MKARLINALYATCGLGVLLGIGARLFRLSSPGELVFDEVYFPVFANKFLHGEIAFDAHPPLGKFFIALGIAAFHNVPFGWRIVPALFGIGLIALMAGLAYAYFKDKVAAALAAIFVSFECMLITYSRIGLMDGILLFFIMASFYAAIKSKGRQGVLLTAVLIGMAVAIKWLAIGVMAPVLYVMWRKGLLWKFLAALPVGAIVYVAINLLGEVLGKSPHPWTDFIWWHQQAWIYQTTLVATHPWSSKWWTWPLMLRPLLFYYKSADATHIQMITAIGNPLLWWGGTLSAAGSVIYLAWMKIKKMPLLDHPLVPLVIGYLAFWLPWARVTRILFIYHYLPSYGFGLLMLVYWLTRAWKKYPWLVLGFVWCAMILGFYYLPLVMGIPQTQAQIDAHLWFKSWL